MKTLALVSLSITTAGILTLAACQKEPTTTGPATAQGGAPKSSPCTGSVKWACSGTILAFDDQAAFQTTYDCLLNEYETWNDWLETTYGYLNDDDYNDMLNSLGYVEDQPLMDFEQDLSFNSYRAKFYALEDQWLAAGADDNDDPDDECWIDDPILATITSEFGAFMIGTTIYWVSPDGTWYEVADSDCGALAHLMSDPENPPAGTLKIEVECEFECACHKVAKNVETNGSYKKAKQKVTHNCGGYAYNPEHGAVQKSYKKYLGLFWGRFKTDQHVDLVATPYSSQCVAATPYDETTGNDRRWRFAPEPVEFQTPTDNGCMDDGETCARFWIYGGSGNMHCINW